MTEWEAGQEVIACADTLGEKESDLLENGYAELASVLRIARLIIGSAFNAYNSHDFGLPDIGGTVTPARKAKRPARRKGA